MIIAIDFDGTIVENSYPAVGKELPHAGEVIRRLYANGHYLILWTCRTGEKLQEAIDWLEANKIPFHAFNAHHPENLRQYGGIDGKKVFADLYIDDRNIGGFKGWKQAEKEISKQQKIFREISVWCAACIALLSIATIFKRLKM